MIKLRCWAKDHVNTENYIIPEDAISHSQAFVEKVIFYRRDVEFHKKQVNDEIEPCVLIKLIIDPVPEVK